MIVCIEFKGKLVPSATVDSSVATSVALIVVFGNVVLSGSQLKKEADILDSHYIGLTKRRDYPHNLPTTKVSSISKTSQVTSCSIKDANKRTVI